MLIEKFVQSADDAIAEDVVGHHAEDGKDPVEPLAQALLGPREATNSSGAEQARGHTLRTEETCSEITQIVPTDVDTAYARVMQRLH